MTYIPDGMRDGRGVTAVSRRVTNDTQRCDDRSRDVPSGGGATGGGATGGGATGGGTTGGVGSRLPRSVRRPVRASVLRRHLRNAVGVAIVFASACQSQPADQSSRGYMGKAAVAIPRELVVSRVVYEGEGVWEPARPGSHAADRQIESFDVALDRRTLRLRRFATPSDDRLKTDRDQSIFVDVERNGGVPATDAGIAARHREFVPMMVHRRLADERIDGNGLLAVAMQGAEARENRGFNANYYSAAPPVNISCNRSIQEVAPFADISTCYEEFALPGMSAGVRAFIKKSDLPRWRQIRAALQEQLDQLVIRR